MAARVGRQPRASVFDNAGMTLNNPLSFFEELNLMPEWPAPVVWCTRSQLLSYSFWSSRQKWCCFSITFWFLLLRSKSWQLTASKNTTTYSLNFFRLHIYTQKIDVLSPSSSPKKITSQIQLDKNQIQVIKDCFNYVYEDRRKDKLFD